MKQTSSNHQANVLEIHVHDVSSNCLMFASSCERGINLLLQTVLSEDMCGKKVGGVDGADEM